MTTWIEVIDTAVKIGLGAAISGIATYKVTKLKFESERKYSTSVRDSEILEDIAARIDKAGSLIRQSTHELEKQNKLGAETDIKDVMDLLKQCYDTLDTAAAYSNLLGEDSLTSAIRETRKEFESYYYYVFGNNSKLEYEKMNNLIANMLNKFEKVSPELKSVYQKIKA